jgi:hypothetical protein
MRHVLAHYGLAERPWRHPKQSGRGSIRHDGWLEDQTSARVQRVFAAK